MKLRILLLSLVISATACSWLAANSATLTADGETLAACIIAEAVGGDTSATTIAVKCAIPAGFDVLGFVGKILADLTSAPTDGGLAARAPNPTRDAVVTALRAVK
jgi:hypothetical protein